MKKLHISTLFQPPSSNSTVSFKQTNTIRRRRHVVLGDICQDVQSKLTRPLVRAAPGTGDLWGEFIAESAPRRQ